MSDEQVEETLVDHLAELRICLIRSLIGIAIGFIASWSFSEIIFDIIRNPISPFLPTGGLVFTAPMDKFLAHIKVSAFTGVVISCPFWLYQVWNFIAPALYKEEKKYGIGFITFGSILFATGVCFVYFVVYPMAFKFLMGFAGSTDTPMITISEYLSFFMTTTIVFGLAFEMPLILTILGMMGIITPDFLAQNRRYAIVLLAAGSAMATPPDVISMALMLIPMLLLYESSILLVKMFGKKQEAEV